MINIPVIETTRAGKQMQQFLIYDEAAGSEKHRDWNVRESSRFEMEKAPVWRPVSRL